MFVVYSKWFFNVELDTINSIFIVFNTELDILRSVFEGVGIAVFMLYGAGGQTDCFFEIDLFDSGKMLGDSRKHVFCWKFSSEFEFRTIFK